MRQSTLLRRLLLGLAACLLLALAIFLASDDPRIWPVRHVLQYALLTRTLPGGSAVAPALPRPPSAIALDPAVARGAIAGVVRSRWGRPVPGATVLVTAADGTAFAATAGADGAYRIADVPVGSYVPVAGAPGFADRAVRTVFGVRVTTGTTTPLDLTLEPQTPPVVTPPTDVELTAPVTLAQEQPLPARAIRRELRFRADGRANQLTYVYTPDDGQTSTLPTLLVVYPGPADQWESVSLPLAEAGYVVVAVGPAYALDLEPDIDDLQRVVGLLRDGTIPRADGTRIGALGGSYSGLHVMRLAIRDPGALKAALLLGPPTDLFELRRQFEAGTLFPPFGLDQALIALGLPSAAPERYWRYSARYHAAAIPVPVMLIHSTADDVVPFGQSELLAAELERLGKPHELHIIEGMGHYLLATERTPAIDDLFGTTIGFFERYLGPADE